jgi:hypothetical protein
MKSMKKIICSVILLAQMAAAQAPTPTPATEPPASLHNLILTVRLLSPLSTRTARQDDVFTASVDEPKELIGAVVLGRISKIKRPKKGTDKAELYFQFESFTLNNQTRAIHAELTGVKNSQGKEKVDEEGHVIGVASHKKKVMGALLGGVAGGIIGASKAGIPGASAGAVLGAAAGWLVAMKTTTAGSDIEFKPGSLFTLSVSDANNR